jgi:hypothetical protein
MLPAKCVAQQAIVSTLDSVKTVAWTVLVDGLFVHGWRLVWFLFDVFYGSFLQAPALVSSFGLVLSILVTWRLDRRRKARIAKQIDADTDLATAVVIKSLQKEKTRMHKALAIRDHIKNTHFSKDPAMQKHFMSVIWPKVTRRVENDERIQKRESLSDGIVCALWKWEGPE